MCLLMKILNFSKFNKSAYVGEWVIYKFLKAVDTIMSLIQERATDSS